MAETIRAGIIGCDTSHCVAFTKRMHDDEFSKDLPRVRVVAACPTFSEDLKSSAGRVEGYKKQLSEQFGIEIVDSIEQMLERVDAVLLESVDGRRHLAELRPVAPTGKPVYIDKPFSASLADAQQMVDLIKRYKLPCFSCSSLRYDGNLIKFMADEKQRGTILGCDAYAPANLEPTNPGFFWYGIHGVEILYTVMDSGCERVQCTSTPDGDLAVGAWKGGRIGSMRGIRKGPHHYGAMVLTDKGVRHIKPAGDFYDGLVREIMTFFHTKKPPVPIDETLEICAFIDAAMRSAKLGGDDVELGL